MQEKLRRIALCNIGKRFLKANACRLHIQSVVRSWPFAGGGKLDLKIETQNNVELAHELAGTIALAKKKSDVAIAELLQSSQQDPYDRYRTVLAYLILATM